MNLMKRPGFFGQCLKTVGLDIRFWIFILITVNAFLLLLLLILAVDFKFDYHQSLMLLLMLLLLLFHTISSMKLFLLTSWYLENKKSSFLIYTCTETFVHSCTSRFGVSLFFPKFRSSYNLIVGTPGRSHTIIIIKTKTGFSFSSL